MTILSVDLKWNYLNNSDHFTFFEKNEQNFLNLIFKDILHLFYIILLLFFTCIGISNDSFKWKFKMKLLKGFWIFHFFWKK